MFLEDDLFKHYICDNSAATEMRYYKQNNSSREGGRASSTPVVLKLFCMFYPFNKDDYQIYPQYIKRSSFHKKTKKKQFISVIINATDDLAF